MDTFERTLLQCAEENNHVELKRLLESGVSPDFANENGETAVWFASRNVCLECLRLLIQFKANLDATLLTGGVTGLWIAAANGHVEVIETLLAGGADPNIPDSRGVTALWTASSYGYHEIVEALLKVGANVNAARSNGETSLWIACLSNYPLVVKLLVDNRAHIESPRADGHTPLMAASEGGFVEIVQFLIDHGAKKDSCSTSGHTALSLAASNGHDAVATLLLNKGADPSVRTTLDDGCDRICPLAQCCAYDQRSTALLLWDRVTDEQRSGAVQVCQQLEHSDLLELQSNAAPPKKRTALEPSYYIWSRQLSEQMSCSGFSQERSLVQSAAADIVQDVYREYFHKATVYVLGSYGDGWGCNLSSLDGSISSDSDIDFTEVMPGQLYHIKNYCRCEGISEDESVFYKHGHIQMKRNKFVGSRPAMTTEASPVSPRMDIVSSYAACCYPPVSILKEGGASSNHFPRDILNKLKDAVHQIPCHCHLIRAGTPNKEGKQLRVSTSILEKLVMRSLSTEQGQFYILLKFITKRVLGVNNSEHQSMGLKSYHAKSLLLFMLRDTPSDQWHSNNLRELVRTALESLRSHLDRRRDDEQYCMPHFFLEDTDLFLKRDHSPKRKIALHISEIVQNLDEYLLDFKHGLEQLPNKNYLLLDVFTLFPFGFSLIDESCESQSDYLNACIRIKQFFQHLLDVTEPLPADMLSQIEDIPQFAGTAKTCARALIYLRSGASGDDAARSVLTESSGSSVCRHLTVSCLESRELTKQAIWQQLRSGDTLWRMCCRMRPQSPGALADPMVCSACFPCRLPHHERRLYLNFDLLRQLLVLRLFPRSPWSQQIMANRRSADFEEFYAVALQAPDGKTKNAALKEMRKRFHHRHEKADFVVNQILAPSRLTIGRPAVFHSGDEACFCRAFDQDTFG